MALAWPRETSVPRRAGSSAASRAGRRQWKHHWTPVSGTSRAAAALSACVLSRIGRRGRPGSVRRSRAWSPEVRNNRMMRLSVAPRIDGGAGGPRGHSVGWVGGTVGRPLRRPGRDPTNTGLGYQCRGSSLSPYTAAPARRDRPPGPGLPPPSAPQNCHHRRKLSGAAPAWPWPGLARARRAGHGPDGAPPPVTR